MRHNRLTYAIVTLISLVLILAFLGACSGSTPAPTSAPPTAKPPATTQAPPPTSAPPAAAGAIKLTASCYLPPAHFLSSMMGDMMKEIQTLSNGKVEITYAAGGSILTGPKTAD